MEWYAIKSRRVFEAEATLRPLCSDVYLPREKTRTPAGAIRERAVIPRLMFIRDSEERVMALEEESHRPGGGIEPFWLYRNVEGTRPGRITQREMQLVMLLTADDDRRCEIYHKTDIQAGDRVRIISGPFEGYEGYARRIRKNKHIVVEIQGICAIALPFIHPALLEKLPDPAAE